MLNLNTNLQSLLVRRSLTNSTNILNQAIERMSTGFKVNYSKDNPANFAISQLITTQLSALDVAEDNAAVGLDLITIASDTLDLISSRFTRLRDLAMQAENMTYGEESLKAINVECQALVAEIKRLYQEAEFNGLKIFGTEFSETISTNGTGTIATYGTEPSPVPASATTFATETTKLQELGIDYSDFQIYNSEKSLIESYETEKGDTIGDIFNVLETYGFTCSITDGVISISSTNGRYVDGDLMRAFGINLDSTEFVSSSSQNSDATLFYTATQTATEATTLGDLGVLVSGTDNVVVKNRYGDTIADFNVSVNTTLGGLFNNLGNYGIQGEVDDGVITLNSSDGNYVLSQGVIANLGIGIFEGSQAVTFGSSQTSSGVVTYETVVASADEVITVPQEVTTTIWTTTTTPQTVTTTIWTTTTTSQTVTGTVYVTTSTPQTVTETIWTTTSTPQTVTTTIWTTTTTPQTVTTTIWTTTTTSSTVTETIITTTTAFATGSTTLEELGITDSMTLIKSYASGYVIRTLIVSPTETIDSLFEILNDEYEYGKYSVSSEIKDGVIKIISPYVLSGDLVTKLGLASSSQSYTQYQSETFIVQGTIKAEDSTVTGSTTVAIGQFMTSVTTINTSSLTSVSDIDEASTISSGTYKITTTAELQKLARMSSNSLLLGGTFVIDADIDMTGITWNTVISNAKIQVYGNGHTISNLTGNVGLFGAIRSVRDLAIVDADIDGAGAYRQYRGLLANTVNGSCTNCFATGSINLEGGWLGGLIGVQTSYSYGEIDSISNCYTSLEVSSSTAAAGLVYKADSIENCFTEGSITGDYAGGVCFSANSVNNVTSSSTITASFAGGIVGDANFLMSNISNVYFKGELNGTYKGAIVGCFSESVNDLDFILPMDGIRSDDSSLVAIGAIKRYVTTDRSLDTYGIAGGNLVITKGTVTTISISGTMTLDEVALTLSAYDIYLDFSSNAYGNRYFNVYVADGTTVSGTGLFAGETSSVNLYKYVDTTPAKVHEIASVESTRTAYTTTTSSTTQTSTVYTTTTSSTTQTNTVWTTTSTPTTQTSTIWNTTTTLIETTTYVTVTTPQTVTETIWTTTTTSTTETNIIDVTQTLNGSSTTVNISITSDTSFADLGLVSRAYITVYNDTTRKIITIKTADTVGSVVTKLNNAGITTSLVNGRLSIAPNSNSNYIAGMSDSLIDALKLDADFYTTSLGQEMTDSNTYIYDGTIKVNNSTGLSEIGVTSGNLVVKQDGVSVSTIAVSDSQNIANFIQQLEDAGFIAYCSNGEVKLSASGDRYIDNADADSSNAISALKLNNVQRQVDESFANTNSDQLEKLSEIVNTYWQASSEMGLQVGTNSDEHSRITISTGFTMENLDRFANIGKKTVANYNYIAELDEMIKTINAKQTELGAYINRLESVLDEISIKYDNLVSSRSTIRDADLAEESSIYIQQQILQQASATLLSVANQAPQLALQLL